MKLAATLVLSLVTTHLAVPAAGAGEVELRAASPPAAAERERMERWHRSWRQEAAPMTRSFDALAALARRNGSLDLRPHCLELAGALLDLDRDRVLPAPDPAVDLHLRDGLRALVRAAVTCLTERPYKARQALAEAEVRFRQVDLVLGAYGLNADPIRTPSIR